MRGGGLKCWVHLTSPIGLIELDGALRLDTVANLRDAVWKVMAERPDAIVLDLASLDDREELSVSVFPALGRTVAAGTDGEMILAAPSVPVQCAMRRAAPLYVRMFGTLSQAMEEATRAPVRRRVSRQLTADPHAGRCARQVVDDVCNRWQLAGLREQARLIVSELVCNAVEHGTAPIELCVTVRHRVLRIEVSDYGEPMPGQLAVPRDDGMHYGLQLIEALARNWGAMPTTSGKTVWAHLVIPTEPGTARHRRR